MKLQNVFSAAFAGLLMSMPALGQDDDPFGPSKKKDPNRVPTREELYNALPKLIQVQMEWIEMDHATVTDLLFLRDLKGDSTGLRKEVQSLVKQGKAEIAETAICFARSGQKATTESVKEMIYPTEYEPAEIPNEVQINASTTAETLARLATPPTPTAFETRNVGTTLEIEPLVGADNKTIDLRFAPEIVKDQGETKWQTMKDSLGNENHISMPLFYTMRMSTGLTLQDGQYRFAGLHSPPAEDGEVDRKRKVMLFVKCDLIAIGEENLPPAVKKQAAKKSKGKDSK